MRHTSLAELLSSTGDSIPEVDGRDYTWTRMTYDAKAIREHHNSRTFIGSVYINNARIPYHISNYAESINSVSETYQYEDGTILMCAVCSEFAGTYAEHDETEIHFFLLTPKKGA